MHDVYIVSAVRSAIGRFGGAFKTHSPVDIAAPVMAGALERAGVEGDALDLVIFGNVLRAGHGQLVPRQAAMKAGIPKHVDAMAVDMVCSSGMMSTMNGATMIKAQEADLLLTGGVESMSGAGFYVSSDARWGYKYVPGDGASMQDIMYRDGLSDPQSGEAMGDQTERLAADEEVSREELDDVAALSHQRAARATEEGLFDGEIIPVEYRKRRETKTLTADEGIRADTTTESLANLRPAFQEDGVLTAGNSSQISDGAAALLLASERAVEEYGLTPIAKLGEKAWSAGESWRFPEAPLPAAETVAEKSGMDIDDFDLIENNEAFAINSVLMKRRLGVPYDKLNVHGGAIALGHPIGCSGARIIVTLLHALRQHDGQHGLASICHGTGGGTAVAVERV
jgi:acetyl-CoA C-acetyltransferase